MRRGDAGTGSSLEDLGDGKKSAVDSELDATFDKMSSSSLMCFNPTDLPIFKVEIRPAQNPICMKNRYIFNSIMGYF